MFVRSAALVLLSLCTYIRADYLELVPNQEEHLLYAEQTHLVVRSLENNNVQIEFFVFNQSFILNLQPAYPPFTQNFPILNGDGRNFMMEFLRTSRYYVGSVFKDPQSVAYITLSVNNIDVFAEVHSKLGIFYIEPQADTSTHLVYRVFTHEQGKQISFQISDVEVTFNTSAHALPQFNRVSFSFPPEPIFNRYVRRRREIEVVKRNRCELKLVVDYSFFTLIGNKNYAYTARYLVNLIGRVNRIFESVDWGLTPDGRQFTNMGFTIKEMKIFDRPTNVPPTHFNANVSLQSNGYFSSFDVLNSFSELEGTNSSCLSFLITGKIFDSSVLGVASIAKLGSHAYGVCAWEAMNGMFMNTGVVTVQRRTGLMVTRVVDLVFAHEMGHSWGAMHDDPNDPECLPTNSDNGRFIMHESSNTGYENNNYQFSNCSIRAIHRILYNLGQNCFVEDKKSLCGNGILEKGEECDPGGQLTVGHAQQDECCTALCRLRSFARCSPKHSECCSTNCSYLPRTTICQSALAESCTKAAYCTGRNDKCPDAMPVIDGIECADEGRCRKGVCVSFCELRHKVPCTCKNINESCLRCCRGHDAICSPVEPHRYLPDGAICVHGQCHKHVCEKEATDASRYFWRIIHDFGSNPDPKHLADYVVFIVIMASLIIWCPCGCFILYWDKKKSRVSAKSEHDDGYLVTSRNKT